MTIINDSNDHLIRFEKIIYLGAAHVDFSPSDDLRDYFEDAYLDGDRSVLPAGKYDDLDEFMEEAHNNQLWGFLVKVSTPVPRYHKGNDDKYSFSFSWGQ